MWSTSVRALAALVLAVGILAAQAGGEREQTFVGSVKGATGGRIGLVVQQGEFVLYLCGQDDGFNKSYSRWLKGKLGADGSFAVASPDGVRVKGAVKGDSVAGTLTGKDGKGMSFQAAKVGDDSFAGVYREEFTQDGEECVGGWIVTDSDVAGGVLNKKQKKVSTNRGPVGGQRLPSRGAGQTRSQTPEKAAKGTIELDATANGLPGAADISAALKRGNLRCSVEVNGRVIVQNKRIQEGLNQLATLPDGERLSLLCRGGRLVGPVVSDGRGQPSLVPVRSGGAAEARKLKITCIGISITKANGTKVCIGVSVDPN